MKISIVNENLLGATLAATLFASLAPRPALAQYTNPYTGTTWNNPM